MKSYEFNNLIKAERHFRATPGERTQGAPIVRSTPMGQDARDMREMYGHAMGINEKYPPLMQEEQWFKSPEEYKYGLNNFNDPERRFGGMKQTEYVDRREKNPEIQLDYVSMYGPGVDPNPNRANPKKNPRALQDDKSRIYDAFQIDFSYAVTIQNAMNAMSQVRPSGVSPYLLRQIAYKCPTIKNIIKRRSAQIELLSYRNTFSQAGEQGYTFKITENIPSKDDQEASIRTSKEILDWLNKNFEAQDYTFQNAILALVNDTMTLDTVAIEVVRRGGKVVAFRIVDAAGVVPVVKGMNVLKYKYFINGIPVAEIEKDDLLVFHRNGTTDIFWLGYSVTEIERLLGEATIELNVLNVNNKQLEKGSYVDKILSVKGTMSRNAFQALKADVYSQLNGVTNANRCVILNAPNGVEVLNMAGMPDDAKFEALNRMVTRIICSQFAIDPFEIGQIDLSGGRGEAAILRTLETRLKNSTELGLTPILHVIENIFNKLIQESGKWKNVRFEFTGLDSYSRKESFELAKNAMDFMTLNEIRRDILRMDELPEGLNNLSDLQLGNLIENQFVLQWYQQLQQQKMQEQLQQGAGGAPGGGAGGEQFDENQYDWSEYAPEEGEFEEEEQAEEFGGGPAQGGMPPPSGVGPSLQQTADKIQDLLKAVNARYEKARSWRK